MAKKSKHDKGAGSTPATVQLEKAGVEFHVYEYEHSNDHMDDGYGVEAATKLGFDEHQVFKTLMADTGSERVVGVVPVSGHMDLKALAAAVGAKKASMADPKVAMRESGYVVGGISPLGQKTRHKTVLDESAMQFDQILVSGGKRGLSVGGEPAGPAEGAERHCRTNRHVVNESAFSHYIFSAILYISLKSLLSHIKFETDGRINNVTISLNYCTLLTPNVSLLFKSELVIASNVKSHVIIFN